MSTLAMTSMRTASLFLIFRAAFLRQINGKICPKLFKKLFKPIFQVSPMQGHPQRPSKN